FKLRDGRFFDPSQWILAVTVSEFCTRGRVEIAALSPGNKDFAVLEQRRRVTGACGVEAACESPGPARRVVQFGARGDNDIAVNSPCNKDHAVLWQRRRVHITCSVEAACGSPGPA